MSNFLLGFGNLVDGATLTGGSYSVSRENLKDYRVSKKARTSDALAASTKVRFALAADATVGMVALCATNASIAAQYRLQLFSDSGFSIQTYDSGTLDLYPSTTISEGGVTRQPTAAEIARFQRNIVHTFTRQTVRYGELAIIDTTNTAGYFEAGRLFVGDTFQPTYNPGYGDVSMRLDSRTDIVTARDGTPYFNANAAFFSIPVAWKWLSLEEAMRWLDIQALIDVSGEALLMWNPAEPAWKFRRQVFGRLKQLDALQHPFYAAYAAAAQIEGVIA